LACSAGTAYETGNTEPTTSSSETGTSESGDGDGDGDPGDGDGDEPDIPAPPMQELVDVGHEREFRGVWVATVYNINWPSSSGLSVDAAQSELLDIIETCEAINLSAIVFQIRPECDALYSSQ